MSISCQLKVLVYSGLGFVLVHMYYALNTPVRCTFASTKMMNESLSNKKSNSNLKNKLKKLFVMKNALKAIFGLALIAAGIVWALTVLNVITIDFSLTGWWAIFVIVPCIIGLFTDKDKIGPLMGIAVGVLLFFAARGAITWVMFGQLALAVMVVGFGIKLLFFRGEYFDGMRHGKGICKDTLIDREGKNIRSVEFSFGKQNLSFDGEKFEGMDVKCSFGAIHLDLRNAVIENDAEIKVESSFSGVVIYLPENLVVKTAINCGFGGVTDNRRVKPLSGSPVLFITGSVGFGGVELK